MSVIGPLRGVYPSLWLKVVMPPVPMTRAAVQTCQHNYSLLTMHFVSFNSRVANPTFPTAG